jgi:hypothetical protein
VEPLAPVAPARPHSSQIGGGEHCPVVVPVAPVAPICTQQDRHMAPRPATASGARQGGGAHEVVPVVPVAPPVHSRWTNAQTQPSIAGEPRIVGWIPPIPVVPLEPVEPVAGHGLHTTDETPPRRPKSRAMLVIGPGHGRQSNQATRAEELTIAPAPGRHGGRWQRSRGRIRKSGTDPEPVEPVVVPVDPVDPPSGHGLHRKIVGTDMLEPLEPVAPPAGHGLQRTRRTILRQRRRIGCPA